MADKVRSGRGVDDRDVVRRVDEGRRLGVSVEHGAAVSVERMGREQQRRAVAYSRARGRL